MRNRTHRLAILIALAFLSALVLQASVPSGWRLLGSKPASYNTGIDPEVAYEGHSAAYLKSKEPVPEGFGTLMQEFNADKYVGKRVRFSAAVKSQTVEDWAGLWMRVDKGSQLAVAFDNMQDRPIRGTSDWRTYEVVLDVPSDATNIAFGILLNKSGSVWISNVNFEIVDSSVPTTAPNHRDEPTNLGFEN